VASAKDESILTLARDRFQLAVEADRDIRAAAKRDLEFLDGQQWNPQEKKEREENGRPALVINKLPQFVDQVVNEQRKARPGAKVSPIGDGADSDTADILEGMLRHVAYISHADVAKDTAFEYAASCGFGYWRYLTEYVDDESFDQELKVAMVEDPFAVYLDPGAIEADRSDMRWAFIVSTLTREEFKRRYKDSKTVEADFFDSDGKGYADWIRNDGVRIAEYWVVESKRRTMYLFADGTTGYDNPEGKSVEKERICEDRTVKQYIINGAEILETAEWAGKWIPIVPVYGKSRIVDGKRKLYSLVRFALDSQALYNYYKTAQAEAVGLSPKAPFIGMVGQFKTKSSEWASANRVPHAYLEYDGQSVGGQLAPPPQRNAYEPPIEALSMGALQSSDDIKATVGIFDPSLGNNKGDLSGRAINALQAEGDNGNFHLQDNLTRSLWHGFRIELDLITKIYDAPRAAHIIKPDHESEQVLINQMFVDPKTGRPKMHDLAAGRYDVAVSVGPNYETRREETRDRLVDLAKADAQSIPLWADLYVKQLDMGPIGDQIAERLTPPQFRDKNDPQAQLQQLQQQGQQAMQMNQALVQRVHELTDVLQSKKMDIDSKERIAAMQAQVALITVEAKLNGQNAQVMLQGELAAIQHKLELMHDAGMQIDQQGAAADAQQASQQHEAQLQAAQQAHQAGLQQAQQQAAQQQPAEA